MRQTTLAEGTFAKYSKLTKKQKFLAQMNEIIPWAALSAVIAPCCPQPEGSGRRPIGIERMLRIHFMQHWFNLSDPAMEEALYDSAASREFVDIDLGREPAPDESTICRFRHLLEANDLCEQLFHEVNAYLQAHGLFVSKGTIVDATLISAPTSTKNKDRQRDPDMHRTRKGQQWYFGMKAHVGVDSRSKLIHSVAVTPANTRDSQVLEDLLQGEETRVWGDSAYSGQKEVLSRRAPKAKDFTNQKGCRNRLLSSADKAKNRVKARVRCRVEHVFRVMKCQFGFTKVRYRGLDKNAAWVLTSCALVNLSMARKRLLRSTQDACA